MTIRQIKIALISRDTGLQTRADMNDQKVEEYREAYRRGDTLPPITLFHEQLQLGVEPAPYWPADGWHRLDALAKNGVEIVSALVKEGGRRQALAFALTTNGEHGLERTNADKRKVIRVLLKEFPEWQEKSDREIARHLKLLHNELVGIVRKELVAAGEIEDIKDRKVTRGGTEFTQKSKGPSDGSRQTEASAGNRQIDTPPADDPKQPSLLIADKATAGGRVQSVFEEAAKRAEARTSPVQEEPELPLPNPPQREEPPKLSAPKCLDETCDRKTWDKSGYCSDHDLFTPTLAPQLLDQVAALGAAEQAAAEPTACDRCNDTGTVQSLSGYPLPCPNGNYLWHQRLIERERVAWVAAREQEKKTLPAPKEDRAAESSAAPEGSYQHWNTPGWLLELVREVSSITLDPCSNQWSTVNAGFEILEVENGLNAKRYDWAQLSRGGLIYLNPPYNDPSPWAERALQEAQRGAEIMLCLPTSHSTDWWRSLAKGCDGLCLMKRRVNFLKEGKENGSSRHETTIFYLGKQAWRFHRIFLPQGLAMLSHAGQAQPQEPPPIDKRQVVLPQEAKPRSEPQASSIEVPPQEEPNDWLERTILGFASLRTTEEVTALYMQLLGKATTDQEKARLLGAYETWRMRYPHAENGRSPRPEKGTTMIEAFIKHGEGLPFRYGIHYLDTTPRRFSLPAKALDHLRQDKRLVVRLPTWQEDGLRELWLCSKYSEGLALFDQLIDLSCDLAERETIRLEWNKWQETNPGAKSPKTSPAKGKDRCSHKQGSRQCPNSASKPSKFCVLHIKKVEGKKGLVGR